MQSQQINDSIASITQVILDTEKSGHDTREAFDRIAESVNSVADGLQGIATSTNELALASREVMDAILEVKSVVVSVKDGASEIDTQQRKLGDVMSASQVSMRELEVIEREMNQKSQEIVQSMTYLVDVVDSLEKASGSLNSEIERFQLSDES